MNPSLKPSRAQLEALEGAIAGQRGVAGRLSRGTFQPTKNILLSRGWIEEGEYIRDEKERDNLAAIIVDGIRRAKEDLDNPPDWYGALLALRRVSDAHNMLQRRAHWITDAGRAVIAAQGGK